MVTLKRSSAELVTEARARNEQIGTCDLIAMHDDPNVAIFDIRVIRER